MPTHTCVCVISGKSILFGVSWFMVRYKFVKNFVNCKKPYIPLGKQAFGTTGENMCATLIKSVAYLSFDYHLP